MAWYWIVLIIFVYFVMSGVVLFWLRDFDDDLFVVIACFLWPVSIAMAIGLIMAHKIFKK